MFNTKECGLRIRNLRTANGLKQIELCDEVYMSERNFRRIERGETPLTVELAVKLADFFPVGLNYLILGETDNNMVAKREILQVISDLTAIAREFGIHPWWRRNRCIRLTRTGSSGRDGALIR